MEDNISPAPPAWVLLDCTVLAKFEGFLHWPARIRVDQDSERWMYLADNSWHYYVVFYNDYSSAWISEANLLPYTEENKEYFMSNNDFAAVPHLEGAYDEADDRLQENNVLSTWDDQNWIPAKNDVVLCQFEIHPPWPSLVISLFPEINPSQFLVEYLPGRERSWVKKEYIRKFLLERVHYITVRDSNINVDSFQAGVDEAESILY